MLNEGTPTDAPELDTPATPADQTPDLEPADEPIDLDAQAEQPVAEDDQQEAEGEAQEQEGDNPEEPEPEVIDFEVDGKALKVPKELEPYLLRHADYTKKTQEVAELRRTAEAKQAEAEQNLSMSNEVIEARAYKLNVEQQLAQYQNVDWAQLEAEDPLGANSHWRQFQQLKDAYGNVSSFLDQKQNEWTAQTAQATDKRLQETRDFAQKEIPGWSPEMDAKITEFATGDLGFTTDMLKQAYNPQVYKTLFYAWLGHQAAQKQAAPKPAPQVQPLRKVSSTGSAPIQKNPEDMSMDEYAAYRKAQLSKGRR